MGRWTKQGIDYFSLDVQFDDKMELYILENEAVGLAVFVTLLQIIYSNEGYYIKNTKDLHLLIKKRINVDINTINTCINAMLEREILHREMHESHGILTSSGIQKRYFDAAKRKKEVRITHDFMVIPVKEYINLIFVDINGKNVGSNDTKVKVKVKVNKKNKLLSSTSVVDHTESGNEKTEKYQEPEPAEPVIDNEPETPQTKQNEIEKKPQCPHKEIIDLYNKTLPVLIQVKESLWKGSRAENLRTRWKEDPERQILEWWKRFFENISKMPWLLGQNDKGWKADLGWILKSENFIKILEGKYHQGPVNGTPIQTPSFDYSPLKARAKIILSGKEYSLDDSCSICNDSGKMLIDPSQVRRLFRDGKIKIVNQCHA